jgi:hypothetical protein
MYAVQLKTMPKGLKFQLSIFIQNLCKLLYHRVEDGGMDFANSTRGDKRVSLVCFMASETDRMTPNRGTSLLLLLAGALSVKMHHITFYRVDVANAILYGP